jgi:OOP family OmpA-OmpF porin
MKTYTKVILAVVILFTQIQVRAQFNILDKVKEKTNQRAEQKTDEAIDKGLDKTEEEMKSDKNSNSQKDDGTSKQDNKNSVDPSTANTSGDLVAYGKYDFVPGTKIIFYDDLKDEAIGEFPSKWNLAKGKVEIAKLNGDNVIAFLEGNYASIFPLWKTKGDYLPDQFTVEFDHFVKPGGYNTMAVGFRDGSTEVEWTEEDDFNSTFTAGKTGAIGPASGDYPKDEYEGQWHHVAIAYNKGNVKIYADQFRLCNAPHVNGNPATLYLGCIGDEMNTIFIKNIKIAEGGGDLYKRVMSDGKIISRGILFDVNKATLKPQSMGPINEIAKLMNDHPELKFEVDGYTDSDGDDAANMKLSEQRAESVKSELVTLGINSSRVTAKGFGETKPADSNETPEGKANNRRVEFVKM